MSDESLAAYVPSYTGLVSTSLRLLSYHDLLEARAEAFVTLPKGATDKEEHKKIKESIDFLHHDNELLIAAELGNASMIRLLIE